MFTSHWLYALSMEKLPYGVAQDNSDHKSIIFEATIVHSLKIWHAFFGLLGGQEWNPCFD